MQVQPTQLSTPNFSGGIIKFQQASGGVRELINGRGRELTVDAAHIVRTKPLNMDASVFLRELGLVRVLNPKLLANLTSLFENMSTIVLGDSKVYSVKASKAVVDETRSRILNTDEEVVL